MSNTALTVIAFILCIGGGFVARKGTKNKSRSVGFLGVLMVLAGLGIGVFLDYFSS